MPIAQLTANALIGGAIISLVAVGFSLIYATNRFAHFAHGAVVAAGGYMAFLFGNLLGMPFFIAAIFAVGATALLGLLLYELLYRPLKQKNSSMVVLLIASIALMILIENLLLLSFGSSVKALDVIPVQTGISLLGAVVTPLQLSILGISVLLFIGLWLFMKRSRFGKIMRAVADNPDLASITGINVRKVERASFIIASGFAGVAGILIGLEQNLLPSMGTNLIIRGFTGAVIGGITSVPGSVLGGYILAFAENYGIWFLPSSYKAAIAFVLLLIFLIVRPQGIFGIHKGTRR